MIRFKCPRTGCEADQQVQDSMAGRKLPCRQCGGRVQVPSPPKDQTVCGVPGSTSRRSHGKEWYYERDREACGPVREADLKALAQAEELKPRDPVWTEGMARWQPARTVLPRLFTPAGEGSGSLWETIGVAIFCVTAGLALVLLVVFVVIPLAQRRPLQTPVEPTLAAGPAAPPVATPPTTSTPPAAVLGPAEVAARCAGAVARVQHRGGTGSGFLAGPNLVVTNAHVVAGDVVERIRVTFPSRVGPREEFTAQLLYEDSRRDLAVLLVRDAPASPLTFADAVPAVGKPVVAIGSPGVGVGGVGVLENAVTAGRIVSAARVDGIDHLVIDANINRGNSGGPVFDEQGRVVGVVSWSVQGRQGQNFAVALPHAREALDRARRTLAAGEVDRVGAEHDLRDAFERIALGIAAYSKGIRLYAAGMIEAERNGGRAGDGIRRVAAQIDPAVEQIATLMVVPLRADVSRILNHGALPVVLRGDREMDQFWRLYLDLKAAYDAPAGTTAAWLVRCQQAERDRKRLTESLQGRLGVGQDRLAERARLFPFLKETDLP